MTVTPLGRRAVLTGIGAAAFVPMVARAFPPGARDWPTARPADKGLDPDRLAALVAAMGAAGERQGLVIVRDGRLVFEHYWANAFHPADPDWRNVSFSAGKSWGATLVGRAVTQGRLALDDITARWHPPERSGLDPRTTVRHLLTMSSGGTLVVKPSSKPPRRLGDDTPPGPPDEYRRLDKPEHDRLPADYGSIPPGTRFVYDGAAADHLADIVSAAVGEPSHDYMKKEVIARMGATARYQPEGVDSRGNVRIGGSMLLSCRDLARLGQLYLDGGMWNGERLIDAAFVTEAISPSPLNPDYGFLWWLNRSGRIAKAPKSMYFAAGARGQYCFVVPESRTVVATMGFGREQLGTDPAWDMLAPALG